MKEKDIEKEKAKLDETAESNLDATKEELEMGQEDDVLKKIQEEKEEINSRYLRMTADFQNYKKRVEKEKSDIYNYANEKLILDLLPIVDNLERAIQSSNEEGEDASFKKGVDMVLQQFLDVLNKNGAKEIDAKGQSFDPNYHHAVMQEDHPEYESNTVIEVFQKGYTLNEKVIRPSMVKVAN
jgi:molecular chaperone GrpE